ncbi:MAG: hypothetical protein K2L89_06050, partial [Muribaculaceae bacterium]|nr:hypothetical protein [Muribaculaceae bacterium]
DPVVPETYTFTHDGGSGVNAVFMPADEDEVPFATIMVTGTPSASVVKLTINVPEGWDGFFGKPMGQFGGMGVNKRKAAPMWTPISEMQAEDADAVKIEDGVIEIPADGKQNMGFYMLYKGDMADSNPDNALMVMSTLSKYEDVETGVNEIAAETGAARYFNLQGVEVANPENGVFVKVANGKASKVVVK